MQVQGTMPELEAIETTDAQLIQNLAIFLSQYYSGLDHDYEAIAFVLVKVGTLLWLSLSHEKIFRQRLVAETKRLTLSYLQSYFPVKCHLTIRLERTAESQWYRCKGFLQNF